MHFVRFHLRFPNYTVIPRFLLPTPSGLGYVTKLFKLKVLDCSQLGHLQHSAM